jgi:hypothetical protein
MKTSAIQVVAFEPSETARQWLLRNLQLNRIPTAGGKCMVSSKTVARSDTSEACTLDTLLPVIQPPCVVKIDVEGAEVEVLNGASGLLRRDDIRWIVEVHSRVLEDQCQALFAGAGLRTRIVDNAWWRVVLPEMRPLEHNRWLVAMR